GQRARLIQTAIEIGRTLLHHTLRAVVGAGANFAGEAIMIAQSVNFITTGRRAREQDTAEDWIDEGLNTCPRRKGPILQIAGLDRCGWQPGRAFIAGDRKVNVVRNQLRRELVQQPAWYRRGKLP